MSVLVMASACQPQKSASDTGSDSRCSGIEGAAMWAEGTLTYRRRDCAEAQLVASVHGTGGLTVELIDVDGGWQPLITATEAGRLDGFMLSGTYRIAGVSEPVVWRQGYQSWSHSGVAPIDSIAVDERDVPLIGGDGDAVAVKDEAPGTSWWVGAIGRADGESLLIGALGAQKTRFYLAFDDERVWAVWGHRGDSIELDAGETVALDPIWLGSGADPQGLHEDYAEAVAERIPARVLGDRPPTGWATWYHFFEDISEVDVRANLAFAETELSDERGTRLEVFQIDDGWQRRWGDWQAGDDFPSGMPALASDIAAAGFTPGLWMAPFYVSRSTDTYRDHPDWWVKRIDGGGEISFSNLGTGDYAVLDPTHPEAATWLANEIASKVADGWTYLKLDFLYAGAQVGERHDDVTGIEAFHVGMQVIREAAGDAWILACGAPFLPSHGYAESFRTGADIAFGFDRIPKLAYLRWAARSTAARGWTNGRWWWIDPDQLLVRPPFSDEEVTGALVANAVSGGTWMLGDDLPALPGARLALATSDELMSLRGQSVRPQDPLQHVSGVDPGPPFEDAMPDDSVPVVWRFEGGVTAYLNLSSEAVEVATEGGTELISGATSGPTLRRLESGAGELWAPD